MMINKFAVKINEELKENSLSLFEMLSPLGKSIYMPQGIVTQSAEAKNKATRYNATVGIAVENKVAMYLSKTQETFREYDPNDIFPYAPLLGKPELRKLWKKKILNDNPDLKDESISLPIVSHSLTHGIALAADLFADVKTAVVTSNKFWGNYRLSFEVRGGATVYTYPFFDEKFKTNINALEILLKELFQKYSKVIFIGNFPLNPIGYTPSIKEMYGFRQTLLEFAQQGNKIVTVSDDAYFGLYYSQCYTQSFFTLMQDLHENIISVKVDGPTKEFCYWGFRVGFVTFNIKNNNQQNIYELLEQKVSGLIRGTVSNCSHPAQTLLIDELREGNYKQQIQEKKAILKERYLLFKQYFATEGYNKYWEVYPFNSGYFFCLKLKKIDAYQLRQHLLEKYAIGIIAIDEITIRIALSAIDKENIEDFMSFLVKAAGEIDSH